MADNIKVVVKIRPLITREIEDKLSYQWKSTGNTLFQLDASGKETGNQFTFDKVYDVTTKTADVYKDVAKPIVEAAVAGFNGTIFAYGQTSSGKTYTMSGTEDSLGIIQLAVLNLFNEIRNAAHRDFLVRVSFVEIYNETIKDLLNPELKIRLRDTPQGLIKLEAKEILASSPDEVLDIMKKGEANRQTAATNMNEGSSRSHSIFQITIESREQTEGKERTGKVKVSQLNLVDLAGSERSGQIGATGIRFKEGTHINKSLSTLGLVIRQLSETSHNKPVHVNYRDSKLTRILQNSLGGNAKTSIICTVTPAAVEETISTLQFANRAKAVKNEPEVNAVATDCAMIEDLRKELSKLKSELAIKNNVEHRNRILMKQKANLEKMILNSLESRSVESGGARRKTRCAPRRMTISEAELRPVAEEDELRPVAEEDELRPVAEEDAPVPRFRTSFALPTPREFKLITQASNLSPVSEENITPQPNDKKVNFEDEIIDLDSDEDTASNTSRCSPYHKCQSSTNTPTCVLRQRLKIAEKNLKDIEELTERETFYKPEVVEYIEKLEESRNKIYYLKREIKSLCVSNMEKESEIELLKKKITQTEQEVQTCSSAKEELEARCKNYNAKLTELEVTYEVMKTKFKLREDELLSLVNDQTCSKKPKECSECMSRTLINKYDMFKNISGVRVNDKQNKDLVKSRDALKDELKNAENRSGVLAKRLLDLEKQNEAYRQGRGQLLKELEDLKNKLYLLEREKEVLRGFEDEVHIKKSSLKEGVSVIEGLKTEAKSMLEQNGALKKQFEEAAELYSQLQINIKSHEKTAEILCKIISRLEQEKETNSSSDGVKEKELKEMSQQCEVLQNKLKQLTEDKNKCQQEAQELREAKESLETHCNNEGKPETEKDKR